MCGIIGSVSERDISDVLLEGLRRLEYRGYDSAGMALIDAQQNLHCVRIQGKVQALADAIKQHTCHGITGIAHTRWATHGKPSENNAHPQISNGQIAVVHNGIIENHDDLRHYLQELGYIFTSETDTEVAAHLIHYYCQQEPSLLHAVQKSAAQMEGAFALGVIQQNNSHELIALRKGSPLVIGMGINENFIASDTLALRSFAQNVIYLEEGDSARITSRTIECFDTHNQPVQRPKHALKDDHQAITKGNYRHFMLKEIFEQNHVLADTLNGRINSLAAVKASFGTNIDLTKIKHVQIVACGTSYHAGLIAKYWLESIAKISTHVDIASEYRYRDVVVDEGTLFVTISQSGETADTLAALQQAKQRNYLSSLAICNVASSSLVRESSNVFLTRAGVEIGVASTKAFTTQLTALLLLATALCPDVDLAAEVLQQLAELPNSCEQVLSTSKVIEELASLFNNKSHALFLGRGINYPVALEGALKLKEISYIHAEAYPAGELKHGPLALVDQSMPVIVLAPNDHVLEKLKSNMQEVSARGGQLFIFTDEPLTEFAKKARIVTIPTCSKWISPIIYTIPLQLLAYHVAVAKGTDVDQPRNLAKSVTVE
jgi:glutamine---fructose-6-phosphate transaminase (isomerizing)